MPAFDANTPRRKVDVLKIPGLTMPLPYAAGHELNDEEAEFMNARLIGIMGNSYGGDVRREQDRIDAKNAEKLKAGTYTGPMWTTDDGTPDGKNLRHPIPAPVGPLDLVDEDGNPVDHQARLDAKFANYKPGGVNTRTAAEKDPIENVARDIAVRETKAFIVQKGYKVKQWMDTKNPEWGSEFNRLVNERLNGKHKDRIYALAKAQIEDRPEEDDEEFVVPEEIKEAMEAEDKEAA